MERSEYMKPQMKPPVLSKGRKFILRPYRRVPTWFSLYYLSGEVIGKGVVTNLSCAGMRVLGDHALKPGTELALRFSIEEDQPPVEITRATVRWVNEYDCGLQIENMNPLAARRIAAVLNHQVRTGRTGS